MKTVLVKHSEFGNKHVPESEVKGLVAEGWTAWPRSKEEKEGTQAEQADKPRRGRPPKAREPAEDATEALFTPALPVRAEEPTPTHRKEF